MLPTTRLLFLGSILLLSLAVLILILQRVSIGQQATVATNTAQTASLLTAAAIAIAVEQTDTATINQATAIAAAADASATAIASRDTAMETQSAAESATAAIYTAQFWATATFSTSNCQVRVNANDARGSNIRLQPNTITREDIITSAPNGTLLDAYLIPGSNNNYTQKDNDDNTWYYVEIPEGLRTTSATFGYITNVIPDGNCR